MVTPGNETTPLSLTGKWPKLLEMYFVRGKLGSVDGTSPFLYSLTPRGEYNIQIIFKI